MPTNTAPTQPRYRGEGHVYRGTLTDFHGQVVAVMADCNCAWCWELDPWDEARRVTVRLTSGAVLEHARCSSFERP